MPHVTTDDGVALYEEAGEGTPIIFVHEYAGDCRLRSRRRFPHRYRCIRNARGYPPSDVRIGSAIARSAPGTTSALSWTGWRSRRRMWSACRWAGPPRFISASPIRTGRCRSWWRAAATVRRPTSGSSSAPRPWRRREDRAADHGRGRQGLRPRPDPGAVPEQGPARLGGVRQLCEHSTLGAANTMRGVQSRRPSLYDLTEEMAALTVPTLIMTGDEDEPCLDPGLLMKRTINPPAWSFFRGRAHAQHRRSRAVQPVLRRFLPSGGERALGPQDERSLSKSILSTDK